MDKQHNSTRLHFILNSGRLDDFVTVWMVPTGGTTSGCKVGTRIRRSTADRQRRCEGKRLRRLGSLVGGRNGLQASSFQMMRVMSAMVTQGGLFHSWRPMGSLRQEGPVVDEEEPRRMENSITVCRPIAECPEGTDDRRGPPRAAPALATQYPGLDNQLNRQIEASRRPKTASVVAEKGVGRHKNGIQHQAAKPRGGSAGQVLDVGPSPAVRCFRNGVGVVRIGGRSPQGPRRRGRATPPRPDADKSPADEDTPNGPPRSPGLVAQLTGGGGCPKQ